MRHGSSSYWDKGSRNCRDRWREIRVVENRRRASELGERDAARLQQQTLQRHDLLSMETLVVA
jgi:hypothetical protein